MAQEVAKIFPKYLNTDAAFDNLEPDESPFLKDVVLEINGNDDSGSGTGNPSGEGQNESILTVQRSNKAVPSKLPNGTNKNNGSFRSELTNELYYFNKNSGGVDGIYVLDGNTGIWKVVVEDANLNFSDDPEAYTADHRVRLRVAYDSKGNIIEKFLTITDGKGWQKWVNVLTALGSNGFDDVQFPYFKLRPPHFDRRELLEWAVRPIMYNPVIEKVENTPADAGKVNHLIDKAIQIAVAVNYTDGRSSVFSPYSDPLIINQTDFQNSPDSLPKNALITIYAGSCMVESIDVFKREVAKQTSGVPAMGTWGDWMFYERIYRFSDRGSVLGTPYWTRTGDWADYNYDPVFNTIEYPFDNSKLSLPIDREDALRLQNDLPQVSVAQYTLGDANALANNRYDYNNCTKATMDNVDVLVKEKEQSFCNVPLRKIRVYAYAARTDSTFSYISQLGYYNGDDKQMRWGGLITSLTGAAKIDFQESKTFGLDFADRNAFRVYVKGTPYFADGKWFQANFDNSLTEIPDLIDASNNDTMQYVQGVFRQGGYFVCVFDLVVPAGRYQLAIGRHNVPSTGDYRNTSTYVYGIANSRVKNTTQLPHVNDDVVVTSIKPRALVSYNKEMEVDCTSADVDVWGNGEDLFYIFCPDYTHGSGAGNFRFIEGYFQESADNPIPVEQFPYQMYDGSRSVADDFGQFTDKNGFYWGMTKVHDSDQVDIRFIAKVNCANEFVFTIGTSESGIGYKQNKTAYLDQNNSGKVGDCNRIIYTGRMTSLDGKVNYSNIAISIKEGSTVYTKSDGTFQLIIHNGMPVPRVASIHVNAGGNFRITTAGCGTMPVFQFDENFIPCTDCNLRIYPIQLNLSINAEGGTQTSLKENALYEVGFACADLAGRLQYVQVAKRITAPSFLSRGDVLATYFQMIFKGKLNLEPDLKWFAPYVSSPLNILNYLQWVGDSIKYVDGNGNVVTDPASAAFCSIAIDSFYNYNVANNFSLLAGYQFKPEDRLRVLDDGDGHLLNISTYGEPIDLQVLGTSYNQAAMAVGLIPNNTNNPVNNITINTSTATQTNNNSITLYVKYDSRLDKLIKKTGFWIELYTPVQQSTEIPYNEMAWHPVVGGEVVDFNGYDTGVPVYNHRSSIDIDYWDTYLFQRTIAVPTIGDKFFNHPFESANVSDGWGYKLSSGGRINVRNENARQMIYNCDTIKSDNFVNNGILNGIGTFRSKNRKSFSDYAWGGILGVHAERSVVFFLCENDWFTTDFNFHYTYSNAQGVMVTNLDQGLSTPHQKISGKYGCAYEHTGTFLVMDGMLSWYDYKNAAQVICTYSEAIDISRIQGKEKEYGIKSYLNAKTQFITRWNQGNVKSKRFDVVSGYDSVRSLLYLTFRPRRSDTNDLTSYVNRRRTWQLDYQETLVYSFTEKRWVRCAGFTPEGYGCLKGKSVGVELYSFAAGQPYAHNNIGNESYLSFYGQTTEPVISCILNKFPDSIKILQNISYNATMDWMVDLIYDAQDNSYSYIPLSYMTAKEEVYYSEVLRDMNTYFRPSIDESYRSSLLDGKRIFSDYFFLRFVGNANRPNDYRQLSAIYYLFAKSDGGKK